MSTARQPSGLLPFQEHAPRQFTSGQWHDHSPRWSPDGTRLAFLSDRAERGKASLYVVPIDGGEAQRVFDQQGDMRDLRWSPDGSLLTLLVTEPETEEEKQRKDERDDAKVWDTNYKFQRLWSVDPTNNEAKPISPEKLQVWGYAWSQDSRSVVINTTNTPRYNDTLGETEVMTLNREGGNAKLIFTLTGTADDLSWSSDGDRVAYRGPSGKAITGDTVYSRSVSGGEPTQLTPDYPGTVDHITPIAGGEALLLVGTESVNSVLYRLEWDGTRTRITAKDATGTLEGPPTVSSDGNRVAAIKEDFVSPPEVWTFQGPEGNQRTTFNDALRQAAFGEPEIVRWTSDPGVEVEGILYKPHGYIEGRRYPLIVSVHGGPTWLWSNRFYGSWHDWGALLAGRGFAVLMPNPRGSTGRGSEYLNALFGEVGRNEYRDMLAGVDAMIERGIADPDRLGVGGWSWGGYMTAWTVSQTDRFKAAVMGAGLPNMISDNSLGDIPSANLSYFEKSPYEDPDTYFERSAIRYIRNASTPTLILHGEADTRVSPSQSIEMYIALQQVGVESTLVTYPREGHSIRERKHQLDLLNRVVEWYERFLCGGSS